MEEIWKDIKGYEGSYQVSNMGRMKSIKSNGKEIIMKQVINKYGYCKVKLYKNRIPKTFSTHRFVGETFIENPLNKPQINHKSGIKTDNRASNLEFLSPSDNVKHAFATGLVERTFRISIEDVYYIWKNYEPQSKEFSSYKLAKMFGVSPSYIMKVVHGVIDINLFLERQAVLDTQIMRIRRA